MAEETYREINGDFELRICRDGLILLRVAALESETKPLEPLQRIDDIVGRWGKYLDYLNAFYLLLDSATIKKDNLQYFSLDEVTIKDAFRIRYENGKVGGYDLKSESTAWTFQMGRLKAGYGPIPIENDHRIIFRRIIPLDTIDFAVQQFKRVFDDGLQSVLASFAKSISEYKVGNYETAIVLAWFITERIINQMWKAHLISLKRDEEGGQQRINSERMEYLTGRDYSASIMTNLLELYGVMPFSVFKDVDSVRRFRNKIVHSDERYSSNATDAQLSITTALELFRSFYQMDFAPNLSFTITYI